MIEFGFAHFLQQLDPLGWVLLGVLGLLSLASWTFFLIWAALGLLTRGQGARFAAAALATPGFAEPHTPPPGAQVEAVLLAVVREARDLADAGERFAAAGGLAAHLTRGLRQQLDRAVVVRERGLTLLATAAATAPYLGLLGTVWGIYHALLRIAGTGEAGLAAVAGPIGEALVMTALGLAVAIPAVFAHNLVQRRNRLLSARWEDFAATLLLRATAPDPVAQAGTESRSALRRMGG
jgi:biopolymer transport protein ExbB